MRWFVPTVNSETVARLRRELNIPPLVARLLVLRGIEEPEAADRFLNPSLRQLHDPFLMAGMDVAVARLRRALERQEKILIYGDYDVDGTMAVVVLLTALRSLGAKVETHIPHRLTDGYGMRVPVIEQAAAEGYGAVLSVDTGIREHAVIARARELGVDCIVTDHHLPESRLPAACAILNPRRTDCAYPEKNLSGVGVAFKLAQALLGSRLTERLLQSYLKVVAIGTIADVVPLLGENRIIAHFGLAGLRKPVQVGLEALLSVAGLGGRAVTAGDVGFCLAPRLNAAGRLENARDVIDLFTTSDAAQAREIAGRLEVLNRERQRVEEQILDEITARMEQHPAPAARSSLVFSGVGWHRGVIGIVAQRLVERYHRPALVIGVENGVGQGSGRSIARFHLLSALAAAEDLFERFGGHAQAAGFTLSAHRIEELERRLETYARTVLSPQDLEPVLRIDQELNLRDINWEFYESAKRLEPYGFGNPTPVFAARGLRLAEPPRILKEKHLKLKVTQGTGWFDAVAWGWGAQGSARRGESTGATRAGEFGGKHCFPNSAGSALAPGQELEVAFALEGNLFQELVTLQLVIKDFRANAAWVA